ncbi:MAG: hypothetical protein WCP12_16080 [bacterium]
MKSKDKKFFLHYVIIPFLVWCVVFGDLCVFAENGPFCTLCNTVQLKYISETEFNIYKDQVYNTVSDIYSLISYIETDCNMVVGDASYLYGLVNGYVNDGILTESQAGDLIYLLNEIITMASNTPLYYASGIRSDLDIINTGVDSVLVSEDEYCVSCSQYVGDDGGGCTCTCNCPDYSSILTQMLSVLNDQKNYLDTLNSNILSIKNTLSEWFIKWQAQDDKIQPFIDEFKPILSKIDRLFSDYQSSDFSPGTWGKIKTVFDDLTENQLVSKWNRFYNDYTEALPKCWTVKRLC